MFLEWCPTQVGHGCVTVLHMCFSVGRRGPACPAAAGFECHATSLAIGPELCLALGARGLGGCTRTMFCNAACVGGSCCLERPGCGLMVCHISLGGDQRISLRLRLGALPDFGCPLFKGLEPTLALQTEYRGSHDPVLQGRVWRVRQNPSNRNLAQHCGQLSGIASLLSAAVRR